MTGAFVFDVFLHWIETPIDCCLSVRKAVRGDLMCHGVGDDVDSERIRDANGVLFEVLG